MINKPKNECIVSGKLYGFGRFGLIDDGEKGIRGSIVVLVNPEDQTTVEVHFAPQKPTYKTGKENTTYRALKSLIDCENTVEKVGEMKALSVRCTCSLTTNIYYTKPQGSSDYVVREPMQVRGLFLHIDDKAKYNMGFNIDCLVESVTPVVTHDGNDSGDRNVKCKIFDDYYGYFRSITLKIRDPQGIAILEHNVLNQPYYVRLSGTASTRVVINEKALNNAEMAFGEAMIVSTSSNIKEFLITGATAPLDFNMTDEEMKTVKNNRAQALAEARERAERKPSASSNSSSFLTGVPTLSAGLSSPKTFDF